jgi:prepilin-type N-terminal cleavage/methylation domain-containing protein
MKMSYRSKGFTLVELLATIAIMAVLIVAALPYVADYTTWARSTSQKRDSQVVAGAIARWIAVGGSVSGWSIARFNGPSAWTNGTKAAVIIQRLVAGWTVVPGGSRDPFLAPNTSFTAMGARIKIGFTSSRSYTVAGRSN